MQSRPFQAPGAYDAVDLFAGPGGWDVAARRLDLHVLGLECDAAAVATRQAAMHATLDGDLTTLNPRAWLTRGQIGSPPCEGFSPAGRGRARQDTDRLLVALEDVRTASDVQALIADARTWMKHPGTALVLEPLLWALTNTPSWIAWEQVPPVRVLWEACAVILRRLGYSVAVAVLDAEAYGVPQARRRAVLVARAPWMTLEHGPAAMPAPTHSRFHRRTPEKLDAGVAPWISLADALEWVSPRPALDPPGDCSWVFRRPSPTVVGSYAPDVVAAPGYRKPGDPPRQRTPGSVRVTLGEAGRLQSFPDGYPWQGSDSKRWQQVGNAVPPLLAEAILCAVTGLPKPDTGV